MAHLAILIIINQTQLVKLHPNFVFDRSAIFDQLLSGSSQYPMGFFGLAGNSDALESPCFQEGRQFVSISFVGLDPVIGSDFNPGSIHHEIMDAMLL
jgi:hypothetical protein